MFSAQPKAIASSAVAQRARRCARRPARRRSARSAPAPARAGSCDARRRRGARWRSQSASERPICSVCRRNSALSRVCAHPVVERRDARAGRRACQAAMAAAGQRPGRRAPAPACSWSTQPGAGRRPRRATRPLSTAASSAFGIAEAADRQRRRGQPHQLQQCAQSAWLTTSVSRGAVVVPVTMAMRHDRGRARPRRRRPRARRPPAPRCTIRCMRAQHVGQHRVGLDLQVVGLQFDRHMAVAQVVGGAHQVEGRAVCGQWRTSSTGCGAAITRTSEPSSATSTSPPRTHAAARQEDAERAAGASRWRRSGCSRACPSRVRRGRRA